MEKDKQKIKIEGIMQFAYAVSSNLLPMFQVAALVLGLPER